jgi:hypothetical protein
VKWENEWKILEPNVPVFERRKKRFEVEDVVESSRQRKKGEQAKDEFMRKANRFGFFFDFFFLPMFSSNNWFGPCTMLATHQPFLNILQDARKLWDKETVSSSTIWMDIFVGLKQIFSIDWEKVYHRRTWFAVNEAFGTEGRRGTGFIERL